MGKSSGVDVPGPTAQEQELLGLQIQALKDALGQSGLGTANIQALQPLLFEQLGLKPTYEMKDVFGPGQQATQAKIDELSKIPEFITQTGTTGGGGRGADRAGTSTQVSNPAFAAAQQQLTALKAKLGTFTPIGQESTGKITGFDKIVDPNQALVDRNTQLMNRRLNLALRGKLPVSSALKEDARQGRSDLIAGLQKQLGSGFATSTPGIEALGEFEKNKNIAFDAARRGDITSLSGITQNQSGLNDNLLGNNIARTSGVAGSPFQSAAALAGLSGNPLAFLQNNRQLQQNASIANSQANAQGLSGLGSLAGTIGSALLLK